MYVLPRLASIVCVLTLTHTHTRIYLWALKCAAPPRPKHTLAGATLAATGTTLVVRAVWYAHA
jgi:hypothetical protein